MKIHLKTPITYYGGKQANNGMQGDKQAQASRMVDYELPVKRQLKRI